MRSRVAAPSAMPWAGRPTVASRPASPAKPRPVTLAATPATATRGGIRTGSGPVVTRFATLASIRPHARSTGCAAAHVVRPAPLGGFRAAIERPIGAPIRPRSASTRSAAAHVADPLGPRSARHRLVTGPRRPAQGPPRHPPRPPPLSSRAPMRRRGPIAAHTIDGFRILGSGLEFGIENWAWGLTGQEAGGSGQGPSAIGESGDGTRQVEASRGTRN